MSGFVYLLDNEFMPGVFKVGMTNKSPTSRAKDISSSSGVPVEFGVVCFVEVGDARRVERDVHRVLDRARINRNREFFLLPLPVAVGALYHLPLLKRFVDVSATPDLHFGWGGAFVDESLPNPWVDRRAVPLFSWGRAPQNGTL